MNKTSGLLGLLCVLCFGAIQIDQKQPAPLHHGTLAYFKSHCARCHGSLGAAYPDDFTKTKSVASLTEIVKNMAAGQGAQALTDNEELDAQVAFHLAIDHKSPFLTWTTQNGLALGGETTPGAKLVAEVDGAAIPITVTKGEWKLILGKQDDIGKLVLTATSGETVSKLETAKRPYSSIQNPNKS